MFSATDCSDELLKPTHIYLTTTTYFCTVVRIDCTGTALVYLLPHKMAEMLGKPLSYCPWLNSEPTENLPC